MGERQRVEQERIQLLTRLVLAQEDERRRIARDLHDQLGQQLTALRLTLEMLKAQSVGRSELLVQVETLEALARQLDQDVAFRVRELRPTVLENLGLQEALTNYVRTWSKHCGIRAQLHTGQSTDERLSSDAQTMLYRLAQEALNNVAKHARANHVDVVLEGSSEHVSLIIEDNGVGFDTSKAQIVGEGLGLIGMHERAGLVGANLQIESTPGQGTTVIVRAPAVTPAIKTPEMPSLRILVADDHATVRHGLKLLIDSQPDMGVVGEAADGDGVLKQAAALKPDIIVMDISMPGMNGLVATRMLKRAQPHVAIVALTRHDDDRYLDELLRAGASGYVLKQSPRWSSFRPSARWLPGASTWILR